MKIPFRNRTIKNLSQASLAITFIIDHPDLKHIDPVVLKHCHAAAAAYILEAGKQELTNQL